MQRGSAALASYASAQPRLNATYRDFALHNAIGQYEGVSETAYEERTSHELCSCLKIEQSLPVTPEQPKVAVVKNFALNTLTAWRGMTKNTTAVAQRT